MLATCLGRWASVRCVIACLLSVAATTAQAEDWPEFRGPTGQGHAAAQNLPIEWSAEKNVAWKQAIPGKGWSSPCISKGKIYLTSAVPVEEGSGSDELELRALCLDAKKGEIDWSTSVFEQGPAAPRIHSKNSHASPTAIVADGRVYVHFGHQGTACLDLQGKIVWSSQEHKYAPVHGNGGSPALVDGLLVFSCDGASDPYVVALDARTGKEAWKYARPGNASKKFSFATPLVIEANGQKQLIIPGSDSVSALAPESGREIWRVGYDGYSVIPRPVFGHGMVYISTGYNTPVVMAIRVDGSGDVTDTHVAWTMKKAAPHTPSLLLVGKELYMVSDRGVATCLDALTGEPHWQERLGGNYSASPLFAHGNIYLQSEEGSGTVLKAGTTYEKLAENGFGERALASYAVADGALFIRTEKHLYRVQGK